MSMLMKVIPAIVLTVFGCGASVSAPGDGEWRGTESDSEANEESPSPAVEPPALPPPAPPPPTVPPPAPAPPTGPSAPICDPEGFAGEATYYTDDISAAQRGNCAFVGLTGDAFFAAMNDAQYDGASVCGACVELRGPTGDATQVRIVDRCPECKPGDIDLTAQAFQAIAPLSAGRVHITWRYVPCEDAAALRYFFKEGSSAYWTAIQVRGAPHAIAKFEYRTTSGAYVTLPRTMYNFFEAQGGMGPGPYTLRVTDVYGQVVSDAGVRMVVNQEVRGTAQFLECVDGG